MKYFSIAFNLLTTLPIRTPVNWNPGDSGRAGVWFPFVGVAIGGLVAAAHAGFGFWLPSLLASVLAVTVWVILTGGLHLDGLGDCCDGLLHASHPERRLEIMKDSRVGTFGAIGLTLVLALKISALVSLPPHRAVYVILLAASLGRWFILFAGFQPLARTGGMAADFASGLHRSALVYGGLIPLGLAIALGVSAIPGLVVNFSAILLILRFSRVRIGGVTGDIFGLIVEISELITLITLIP